MISRKVHFPNIKSNRRLALSMTGSMLREQNLSDALAHKIKGLEAKKKQADGKVILYTSIIETLKKSIGDT